MMTDNEIRLRCLELAMEHGNSTDKVGVAADFAGFVFQQLRPRSIGISGFAKLRSTRRRPSVQRKKSR